MSGRLKCGSLNELTGCSVGFLHQREVHSSRSSWNPIGAASTFLSRRLDSAQSLYSKNLHAHYGCVNAIEFSLEGDLLVSGGDDRRVLLWDVDVTFSGKRQPRVMKAEHNSNIFSLGFDAHNKKVFSAGNDGKVIVHDLATGEALDMFLHELAVYGVSVHPTIDTLFTSAGEDGQVLLYDTRAPLSSDPLCLSMSSDAYHAVQFHPVEPVFVVTANSRNGVALWDVRKPLNPVIRYGDKRWAQSSMSARFNTVGSQIVALRRRLPPVLYDTHSSTSKCQFDADHYYNSCTMKTCCFAGDKDQYILSGSDDFNLYMWNIPDAKSQVNFVSDAHLVLQGHRSIVNQVRFNSQNFIIASSGVEKIIKLWSGFVLPGSNNSQLTMNRKVFTHEEYIGLMQNGQSVNHDYSNGSTEEDSRMMAFFDSLVQREVEGCTSNTDLSSSDDARDSVAEDDFETTITTPSSSTLTSQSDEDLTGDADEPEVGQTNSSTSRVLRISDQATGSSNRRTTTWSRKRAMLSRYRRRRMLISDEEEDTETTSKTNGSDWILKLIAKKRAQLKASKASKKAKRKQELLRRDLKLRSFVCNAKYLYQPEEMRRSRTTTGDSWLLPVIGDTTNGASPSSSTQNHRRALYPYTVLLVDNSEDNDSADEDWRPQVSSASNPCRKRTLSQLNGDSLWSSDGSSSGEENNDKKTRITNKHKKKSFVLESDSEASDTGLDQNTNNGHVISEVVDTDDSNTSDNNLSESTSAITNNDQLQSVSNNDMYNIMGNCSKTKQNNMSNSDSDSECVSNVISGFSPNLDNNENSCSVEIDNNINDIVPITGLSTDTNGSVLFDFDNNSLGSSLDINTNMDVYLPSTPNGKIQNGANKNNSKLDEPSSEISTPDSGIGTMPSSTEKSEDDSLVCPSTSSSLEINVDNSSKLTFSFKKRVRKFGLKNYRLHNTDNDA